MSSCFEKPVETPCTALARSARSSPCLDRSGPLSPLRAMVTTPSPSTATGKPSKSGCWTLPLGPSAMKWPSFISTRVPLGTAIGIFPIRDMARLLPELAQQLAAQAPLARLPVGQQSLRRRHDPDSEAVAHRLDLVGAAVDPAARAADPGEMVDGRRALGAVAQEDANDAHRLAFRRLDLPQVLDEAFLLEQPGDLELELRARHVEAVVLRQVGVPDPGQQIRDGVGHAHQCLSPCGTAMFFRHAGRAATSLPWSLREGSPATPGPGDECGRARTCGS